jgi:hypothetical protein
MASPAPSTSKRLIHGVVMQRVRMQNVRLAFHTIGSAEANIPAQNSEYNPSIRAPSVECDSDYNREYPWRNPNVQPG